MTAHTQAFQQLRPCVDMYGHRFATHFPSPGQFGYSQVVCRKCGMTPREARR